MRRSPNGRCGSTESSAGERAYCGGPGEWLAPLLMGPVLQSGCLPARARTPCSPRARDRGTACNRLRAESSASAHCTSGVGRHGPQQQRLRWGAGRACRHKGRLPEAAHDLPKLQALHRLAAESAQLRAAQAAAKRGAGAGAGADAQPAAGAGTVCW